jgi:hypothetical protein
MVEGFWIVQFEGAQGNGGGVVLFMKGHVLGGDSGFVYTGDYKTNQDALEARVKVKNFLPDVPSVLGVQGDFELNVKGTIKGKIITGSASLVNQPGMGIVVKLTRVSDLPV